MPASLPRADLDEAQIARLMESSYLLYALNRRFVGWAYGDPQRKQENLYVIAAEMRSVLTYIKEGI